MKTRVRCLLALTHFGGIFCAGILGSCQSQEPNPIPRETFRDPEVLTPDANNVYSIQFRPSKVQIEGKEYCLRTYNGIIAPMIRVNASAAPRRVRVDFSNEFRGMDEKSATATSCGTAPELHHFNVTNFHTHGLHVSPEKTADGQFQSDNVLLEIPPGAQERFRFDLDEPTKHDAGTYWFHAHVHGSTAIQVANGVAGALVVGGPIDDVPGVKEARERVFLMQQIPFDYVDPKDSANNVVPVTGDCSETKLSINDFSLVAVAKRTLINGVLAPTLVMHKGQVERWRFIHAGISQEIAISVRKRHDDGTCNLGAGEEASRILSMHQIAADGITYAAPESVNTLSLEPGYRADVMVAAPSTSGNYCIVDSASATGLNGAEDGNVLGYLQVDDIAAAAGTGALPSDADLARIAKPVLDCDAPLSTRARPMVFAQQKEPITNQLCEGQCGDSPIFNVNCKTYNAQSAPMSLPFGTTEEWQLSSQLSDHPFHIHVNPFTVCTPGMVGGSQFSKPHWKDTLFIRKSETSTGSSTDAVTTTPVRIRTHYEDFKGKFVMHCHKLQHEDQGMMEQVSIE